MSTGPSKPIIKQSNYYTECVHMRRNRLFTHQSRKHNGHWFWVDSQRAGFTISITEISPCIFLSTCINAMLHIIYALFYRCLNGGASDAFVSAGEPRQGDALFTDDLPSAVCYHRSHKLHGHNANTRTDTQKPIPMHPPRCTLIMHIYVCKHTIQMNAQTHTHTHAHTECIWLCYRIRAVQTSEAQTHRAHQPAVYSPLIPVGIGYWHQTLSRCWACTNFDTMFKDNARNKEAHSNSSPHPECSLACRNAAEVTLPWFDFFTYWWIAHPVYCLCCTTIIHDIMYFTGNRNKIWR